MEDGCGGVACHDWLFDAVDFPSAECNPKRLLPPRPTQSAGVNPASAQFHRCDDCNNRATRDMLCVNATCGASSLCTIQ